MSIDAKAVVRQFNEQVIMCADRAAFEALIDPGFRNHSVPQGELNGPESMWNTFETVLRPALADLTVVIHDQIAEGDKVTTRKTISGTHRGVFMGIEATGQNVAIDVIDIVRLNGGRYAEHWGINTLPAVLARLRA